MNMNDLKKPLIITVKIIVAIILFFVVMEIMWLCNDDYEKMRMKNELYKSEMNRIENICNSSDGYSQLLFYYTEMRKLNARINCGWWVQFQWVKDCLGLKKINTLIG